jgi:hypothetical protein
VNPAAGHTESRYKRLTISGPATYQICVQGSLDPSWSDMLHGAAISSQSLFDEDQRPVTLTVLTGRMTDQAALLGVLNAVYSLGLPLVSVARMSEADD